MYYIVVATNDVSLMYCVNKYINEGWECLGGPVVTDNRFYQAMIKKNQK